MAVSPGAWTYLLLRFLFLVLSDSWADWALRRSACWRIPPSGSAISNGSCAFLVCSIAVVDLERLPHAHAAVLGRHDRLDSARSKPLAAADAGHLFLVFP